MTANAFGKTIPTTAVEALREPSALIVWDMQQAIAPRALDLAGVVSRIRRLRAAAHETARPVIYSQHFSLPLRVESPAYIRSQWKRSRAETPEQLRAMAPLGSPQGRFVDDLLPDERDVVLPKTRASFFIGTPLLQVLSGCGVRTLVLTGVATDKGILATARDAIHHGFHPVVVSDAASSFSHNEHRAGLQASAEIGDVASTEEVLAVWGDTVASAPQGS